MDQPTGDTAPGITSPVADVLAISRRQLMQSTAATLAVAQLVALPADTAQPAGTMTAAAYIWNRLRQHAVGHLFGVPGATCNPFFAAAARAGMEVIVTASDFEAGYAADGYARMRGLSCVSVTYGVGTMSMLGTIAGAYAERSPVVIVNGGPTADDLAIQRDLGVLFSHSTGRDQSDLNIFKEVTAYAGRASTAADVPGVVDRAISTALTKKRPVYIEIPKDIWEAPVRAASGPLNVTVAATGEETALAANIIAKLRGAQRPALLLGIEVTRFGLAKEVAALVTKLRVPWATTMLAKSVISEDTPGFIGVYSGIYAPPDVTDRMMMADALIAIGCVFGRQYRNLVSAKRDNLILAANGEVRTGRRLSGQASLKPLVAALERQPWRASADLIDGLPPTATYQERRESVEVRPPASTPGPTGTADGPGLTYHEVMTAVAATLNDDVITVTDTSLSMYPAADLPVRGANAFVCNAVWQSIGYSLGAAVGIASAQNKRVLAITGDGGFQTTAQCLSTLAARNAKATILVLDNGHYGIEQWLLDKRYFSGGGTPLIPHMKLNRWSYPELARAMGFKNVSTVTTPEALAAALAAAKDAIRPTLISCTIQPRDIPPGLPVT
jgi:indolepyruvate decarboxylase